MGSEDVSAQGSEIVLMHGGGFHVCVIFTLPQCESLVARFLVHILLWIPLTLMTASNQLVFKSLGAWLQPLSSLFFPLPPQMHCHGPSSMIPLVPLTYQAL